MWRGSSSSGHGCAAHRRCTLVWYVEFSLCPKKRRNPEEITTTKSYGCIFSESPAPYMVGCSASGLDSSTIYGWRGSPSGTKVGNARGWTHRDFRIFGRCGHQIFGRTVGARAPPPAVRSMTHVIECITNYYKSDARRAPVRSYSISMPLFSRSHPCHVYWGRSSRASDTPRTSNSSSPTSSSTCTTKVLQRTVLVGVPKFE